MVKGVVETRPRDHCRPNTHCHLSAALLPSIRCRAHPFNGREKRSRNNGQGHLDGLVGGCLVVDPSPRDNPKQGSWTAGCALRGVASWHASDTQGNGQQAQPKTGRAAWSPHPTIRRIPPDPPCSWPGPFHARPLPLFRFPRLLLDPERRSCVDGARNRRSLLFVRGPPYDCRPPSLVLFSASSKKPLPPASAPTRHPTDAADGLALANWTSLVSQVFFCLSLFPFFLFLVLLPRQSSTDAVTGLLQGCAGPSLAIVPLFPLALFAVSIDTCQQSSPLPCFSLLPASCFLPLPSPLGGRPARIRFSWPILSLSESPSHAAVRRVASRMLLSHPPSLSRPPQP